MSDDLVYALDEHGRLRVPMVKVPRAQARPRSDAEYDQLADAAYELGAADGKNAATWYFDGNTTRETYRRVLEGILEGDPEIYDTFPGNPLSGEWADDPTPADLMRALGVDPDDEDADQFCLMYEDGFGVAVSEEIERVARYQLDEGGI